MQKIKFPVVLLFALPVLFSLYSTIHAQHIERNDIRFDYIQLPLKRTVTLCRNYQCVAALADSNKVDQKLYEELVSAYIKPQGYKYSTDSALKITINFLKFEYSPELKTIKPKNTGGSSGIANITAGVLSIALMAGTGKQINPVNTISTIHNVGQQGQQYQQPIGYCYYEVTYKYAMSYKIETHKGELIFNDFPNELNKHYTYKTSEFVTQTALEEYWKNNKAVVIQNLQDKLVDEQLHKLDSLLNSDIGFQKTTRETAIFTVDNKNNKYPEYGKAFDLASAGYKQLLFESDRAAGTDKIKKAILIWEKDMKEANPNKRKARINYDVTIATLFNIIEAECWINNFVKAEDYLTKLGRLDLYKKEKKHYEELVHFVNSQKSRYQANK